ncbi:MAG: hypothetical protein HXY40_17165 [Chloroflexi bacterium]|nr:hypothetical protein [Chloroflexota bacterium]
MSPYHFDRSSGNDDDYEDLFDRNNRQARRKRKPKARHVPKKSPDTILNEIAETAGLEAGFQTTYRPGLFEQGWLLDSLRPFYDQLYISDVLALVKGGKEANVYRCEAHERLDEPLLAAKVYRPRMFRQLRNDKMYREGRGVLSAEGHDMNQSVHGDRIQRALGKKTAYGQEVAHTSWLMHEYTTLQKLHALGAAVPRPIAASSNALLMGYCGGDELAAPPLSEVRLARDEAEPLFRETLRNIELMLQHDIIHGDLSAYNILYWEGQITLIDFPQVTNSRSNGHAQQILARDVTRVCQYFSAMGVQSDATAITRHLWRSYVARDPKEVSADLSRMTGDAF